MSCHVHCKDKAVPTCPLPPGQAKLPFGIDVHHGVGTACEGWIKIPKPGGVRRGWQRAYAIVCDFKIFLHEPSNDIHTPAVSATHIFDIRDINFKVSQVMRQDVIHAGPKLIPAIFKMSCNQTGCPGITSEALVLTENETERDRWLATLEELQKAAKQGNQHGSSVFSVREMYSTNQLEVLKGAQSATVMDPDHLLIGDSEGLYMLDMAEEGLYKFGDRDVRKVAQISMIEEEGLIVFLAGRTRPSLRLLPVSAMESGETKNVLIKVTETENCSSFSCGALGHTWYICVAVKTRVLVFQVNRTKNRYEKRREIPLPNQVQSLRVLGESVCVGYQSGFSLYHLYSDQPPQKLVHDEDLTLGFVRLNNLPAMHAVQINNGQEYILCFNVLGVYVNQSGKRSRKQELLWHSSPTSFAYMAPYLMVYCESALEIYDVNTARWIQTIPFRKLHSLSEDGALAACSISDPPILLYIKKQMDEDAIHMPGLSRKNTDRIRASKRKADPRTQKKGVPEKAAISGPINFQHVQHFGPYDSLNPQEMPDAGTTTGSEREQGISGPSPSIQSLSAIQPGPGGPHSRKNSARESFTDAFSNTDRNSTGDMSSFFEKYGYQSGGLGVFLDENGQ
jgi:serine/threonine-protein kinase MRCK